MQSEATADYANFERGFVETLALLASDLQSVANADVSNQLARAAGKLEGLCADSRLYTDSSWEPAYIEFLQIQWTPQPNDGEGFGDQSPNKDDEVGEAIMFLERTPISLNNGQETNGLEVFHAFGKDFATGIKDLDIWGIMKPRLGAYPTLRELLAPLAMANVIRGVPMAGGPMNSQGTMWNSPYALPHTMYYTTELGGRVLARTVGGPEKPSPTARSADPPG